MATTTATAGRQLLAIREWRKGEPIAWIREAEGGGLRPFRCTAATLRGWQKEVLNSWRYPITNALVEGKHNRIKTLKRRAYGYRNDRSFLLRILSLIHTD
jgi:transposase